MSRPNDIRNPIFFTSPGVKLAKKFITLTARGGCLFSSGFVHEESLSEFSHGLLAYDQDSGAILFSFTKNSDEPGAIKLTHRKSKNVSLQSGSFFRYFKLNAIELAGRYEQIEKRSLGRKGQWFVIFLDERHEKRKVRHASFPVVSST